jgi:hypothetical protein
MANLIHDFSLHSVGNFSFGRRAVRLDGYETDRASLTALAEMFDKAEWNVLYKERMSGRAQIIDLTPEQKNIRFCSFDTSELVSGWYALKAFSYHPRQARLDYHPYRLQLYYIGTDLAQQEWYEIADFLVVSNDWGI